MNYGAMSETASTLDGASGAEATRVAGARLAESGVRRRAFVPAPGEGEAPFRLVRELGHGGMGVVWLAQHLRLGIPCALKFLGPSGGSGLTECDGLLREVTMAYQAGGPNVVRVFDHGRWGGRPYIAMELLEGEDLAKRLRRVGCLGQREAWAVVRQIASALEGAHARGVVHRDLKPDNVFLAREGDGEVVKVLDFGVADWLGSSEGGAASAAFGPMTSNFVGTPLYMSPEQAEGLRVDARSDLWSLALVAFECLTGSHPLRGATLGEVLVKVLMAPLPAPSSRLPGLPPALDAWWARATSRERAGRFASAAEFAAEFARALGVGPGARPARAFASVTPLRPGPPAALARAV